MREVLVLALMLYIQVFVLVMVLEEKCLNK